MTEKRKLTMSQMFEVRRLRYYWPSATDEERKKIEARIREIEYGDKEEPPKKPQQKAAKLFEKKRNSIHSKQQSASVYLVMEHSSG